MYFFSAKKYEKENEKNWYIMKNSVGEKPEIILLVAIYICAQNFLSWLQNVNGYFSPSADKHIFNFGVIFKLILKKSYNSKKYLLQIGYYPMGLILCKSNYSPFLIKLSFFSS